jgi:hypothetical protein
MNTPNSSRKPLALPLLLTVGCRCSCFFPGAACPVVLYPQLLSDALPTVPNVSKLRLVNAGARSADAAALANALLQLGNLKVLQLHQVGLQCLAVPAAVCTSACRLEGICRTLLWCLVTLRQDQQGDVWHWRSLVFGGNASATVG